jgi:hypothetical protein
MFVLSLGFSQELCQGWGESQRIGELDGAINESSGVSNSLRFPLRLYHTNDSWNSGPKFFISDLQGNDTQAINLDVDSTLIKTIDIEDADVGPCGQESCLFLADIGDNASRRSVIHMLVLPEQEEWTQPAHPLVLNLHYPDGSHDAEAFAVHPNGDLYILTKEVSPLKAQPARLYRLPLVTWSADADSYTLEFVTSLDLRAMSGSSLEILSHIVTGMDISPDGLKLLILTYGEVFELALDLASLSNNTVLPTNTPYQKIEVITLLQQESISYLATEYGFIYAAEAKTETSPMMQVLCKD